jgi:putative transposase
MRKGRFSEEQIIKILKENEAGAKLANVCRRYGISEPTFYTWKAKFGGLDVNEARRLKHTTWPLCNFYHAVVGTAS